MCREQNISIPRPSTDGGSHDEAEINEPDIADVIRANLLWLRQARGLSLQDLAVVAGVNPAELDELAAGRSFPGLGLLWKLARALDLACNHRGACYRQAGAPQAPRRLPEGPRFTCLAQPPASIWQRARRRRQPLSFTGDKAWNRSS